MEAVTDYLGSRNLIPTDVRRSAAWSDWFSRPLFRTTRLPARKLLEITQQLASLLQAGLILDRALAVIGRLAPQGIARQFIERVLQRIRAGVSFADALAGEGDAVPGYYLSLVRAGEIGGSLGQSLERLSTFLARNQEIRERVRSALIYPCILASMVVLTLIVLLAVVLPRFEALFAVSEAELPWSTELVLTLGSVLSSFGWLILAVLVAVSVYGWRALQEPHLRTALDEFLLRTRWTFGLPARLQSARFLRTVGTLCANGQTLPSAMRIALEAIDNRALRETTEGVLVRLKEGEPLSRLLDEASHYPKLAVQLARVGEETGQLPAMLIEAAELLDRDAQKTVERLLTLLVPAITICIGALVAALIGAMLVGILSINDLAI